MMTWTKVIDLRQTELVLTLPEGFSSKKVRVVVEDLGESRVAKIEQMKAAEPDPLFQADIDEIQADFRH